MLKVTTREDGNLLDSIIQNRLLSLQKAEEWLKAYTDDQFKTADQSKVHRAVDQNTFSGKY